MIELETENVWDFILTNFGEGFVRVCSLTHNVLPYLRANVALWIELDYQIVSHGNIGKTIKNKILIPSYRRISMILINWPICSW